MNLSQFIVTVNEKVISSDYLFQTKVDFETALEFSAPEYSLEKSEYVRLSKRIRQEETQIEVLETIIDEIINNESLSFIVFEIEVQKEVPFQLDIFYRSHASIDRSSKKTSDISYQYFFSPAETWKNYGDFEVEIKIPEVIGGKENVKLELISTLDFEKNGFSYCAKTEGFPSENLEFTFKVPLTPNYSYILGLFFLMLPTILLVVFTIILVVYCILQWKKHRKMKDNEKKA